MSEGEIRDYLYDNRKVPFRDMPMEIQKWCREHYSELRCFDRFFRVASFAVNKKIIFTPGRGRIVFYLPRKDN